MRLGPAAVLCLLTAAAPVAAQPITPQGAPLDLVRFRTLQSVSALPPGDARCTESLPDGTRACLSDRPSASSSYAFRIVGTAGTVAEVVSDYYRPVSLPAFDLARFEDGGVPVYVLVERVEEDATRPMASRWKAFVFDARRPDHPLHLILAEHSGVGSFPVVNGTRTIRATRWEGDAEATGSRGLHLAGRAYRYAEGSLVPVGPVVRRPWTEAFANERRAALAEDRHAWDWTAAPDLVRTPTDPAVAALRVRTTTPGRLGAVSVRDDGNEQVAFLPDDGSAEHLVPVFDLADRATGRLLPEGYVPRGGWPAYLSGRRAHLDTYVFAPSWTDANALLWIER